MKRQKLLRGEVTYRCGATASVEYAADGQAAFERFKADATRRDCDGCATGDTAGTYLQVDDGRLDLWRWKEVTPPTQGRSPAPEAGFTARRKSPAKKGDGA
jgi:hypothetical protein